MFLAVCWGKNISTNLTNSKEPEPHCFEPLEPEPGPLEKKIRNRSRRRLKKNEEPEPLEKNRGAGKN